MVCSLKKFRFCVLLLLPPCLAGVLQAQSDERPNILLAISDDQSYHHTSKAGCSFISTPAFDRLANEGFYFENCYAGSPGCAPSRSALVTGRHHWQNEQSGQHASSWLSKYIPFVDELEAGGYAVGRTGKGVSPFRYARSEADTLRRNGDAGGPALSDIRISPQGDTRPAKQISNIDYFANFRYFMENKSVEQPFFFWYGAREPHRAFEKGSWRKTGKSLSDADVPSFLPDNDTIRGDLLDYAVEIEWFDHQLQQMLSYLDSIGELANTMVIVTSDNGMAFPRAKANCYEYGVHVPLAIWYPARFSMGRKIESPVGFIDLAPTILELTGTRAEHMMAMRGKSLVGMLESGCEDPSRSAFSGRERHSSSRYMNRGYPQRSVRQGDHLLIWNLKPMRWPAGAPQSYDPQDTLVLLPEYSLDSGGKYVLGTIFADIDDSPSKTYLIENHDKKEVSKYFTLATGKRPEFELYDLRNDASCLDNLAGKRKYRTREAELRELLKEELLQSGDPRVAGPDHEIFDSYPRYSKMRKFPRK